MRHAYLLIWLLIPGLLYAQEDPQLSPVPDPPDILPPPDEEFDELEPEITIMRKGGKTIEEYRVNGELYMVRITPSIGPSYYMIDTNGDGNMNVRRSNLERTIQVPQWVIFSW